MRPYAIRMKPLNDLKEPPNKPTHDLRSARVHFADPSATPMCSNHDALHELKASPRKGEADIGPPQSCTTSVRSRNPSASTKRSTTMLCSRGVHERTVPYVC